MIIHGERRCGIFPCTARGVPKPHRSIFVCEPHRSFLMALPRPKKFMDYRPDPTAGDRPSRVHGLTAAEYLERLVLSGQPFMVTATGPLNPAGEEPYVGMPALTYDGFARGRVSRLVSKAEFMEWEKKVFPDRPSMLDGTETSFFEVQFD